MYYPTTIYYHNCVKYSKGNSRMILLCCQGYWYALLKDGGVRPDRIKKGQNIFIKQKIISLKTFAQHCMYECVVIQIESSPQ